VSVYRETILPRGEARGKLVVAEPILASTSQALRLFAGRDGRHEGLVLWLGRMIGKDTCVLGCHVPESDHGCAHVLLDEAAVGRAGRVARGLRLGVVAQVHSHPGGDTRHSEGDDELILLPRPGMFSLVVADYGDGSILPEQGAGLHQYQEGSWVRIDPVEGVLTTVPSQPV
jgi:hypothetical protein